MDKTIGIFVFGMAIGGFCMILAEAYDNTKERKQIMKTIASANFKNYPYRTILLHTVEEVELIETVCEQVFNEQFITDTFYFNYVELEIHFPESATWLITQALQNYAGDGLLIHKCINRIVKG